MSKQVKLRRGTATEHASFTGVVGEVTVDTTAKTIRVHDGATVGGNPLALASGANASGTWAINISGNAPTLTTARTLTIGGSGKTFNGSANVSWTLTEIGAAARGANTDITSLGASTTINGVTIGYRAIPRSTTSGTAVVGDVGKCIAVSAGLTIPNATFAAGDAISIYNDSAAAITITQGTSLTLRWAGTTNTGNRTLPARGIATIWFNSSSEAIISGNIS